MIYCFPSPIQLMPDAPLAQDFRFFWAGVVVVVGALLANVFAANFYTKLVLAVLLRADDKAFFVLDAVGVAGHAVVQGGANVQKLL